MEPALETLVLAEFSWRDVVTAEFPLFMDHPVVKANPNPKSDRHWMFYTDGHTTHMDVFKPGVVEKQFKRVIQRMYAEAYGVTEPMSDEFVERLLHDNYFYLYFHELFHPKYCPSSKNDEKLFDLALYEGIKKSRTSFS